MDCIGLFCEDIREEVGGSHTVIGVMPDNIDLRGREFPKMGFYIRANFSADQAVPAEITAEVEMPGHAAIELGALEPETIQKAFNDATSNDLPFVGVIFKTVFAPLTLSQSGIASLRINVDGSKQTCGTLNIKVVD